MVILIVLAVIATSANTENVFGTFREKVQSLAWTPRCTLVTVTEKKAIELPEGRFKPLTRYAGEIDDPIRRPSGRLLLNARRTKAIGHGFVIDLNTLASRPIKRAAAWDGDRLVEIESSTRGHYRMLRGTKQIPIAPGWFVLGVSGDLRLALACRREPFDGDTTYLLRLQPTTGRASITASYPLASDDHNWLGFVQQSGSEGRIIVHSQHLAGRLATPYFASSKLWAIELTRPPSLLTTNSFAEWIDRTTPWTVVRRRLMLDKQLGFDAHTFDLWNSKSGAVVRLAKTTDYWNDKEGSRGDGPSLGPYAVDWARRRFAYVLASPENSQVLVHKLDLTALQPSK